MTIVDAIKSLLFGLIILILAPLAWQELTFQYTNFFDSHAQLAVLPIGGTISDTSFYVQHLQKLFANPEIKGILIKFDCPETTPGSAETIYTEIQALKRQYPKPVIGFIENVCISSGYWIACAADYLIAPGSAIIGNIGATFPVLRELSQQEKESLQPMFQDIYQQFIHIVAQARKVSLAKIDQWADGKIFSGQQAYKLHLIDEMGSPQRVIAVLKQKALIEGDIRWVYPPICD